MGREISIFNSQRIIIKIGSSLLIDNEKFNYRWLESFTADVIMLKKRKIEVLIVASGAVSLGKNYLGIKDEKISITDKQALAACGQVILMNNFIKAFEKSGIKVAQILLTYSDTEDRRKSLNSRETLKNLLSKKVIPVINENDSVATDELKFGDNEISTYIVSSNSPPIYASTVKLSSSGFSKIFNSKLNLSSPYSYSSPSISV